MVCSGAGKARMATTDEAKGLSSAEAAARLEKYGPNEIARERGPSVWAQLASQFANLTVGLL
ncbi:MAG: hypothetical protein K8I02_03725, partial [Candidatus Methylomirabilis sp.]|nr:hypothetical protein [Deltaproteobacteria bacterium]